jgi:hypothetical protein
MDLTTAPGVFPHACRAFRRNAQSTIEIGQPYRKARCADVADCILSGWSAGSHGQCISVRGLFSRQRSQFAAPALAGNHLICKEEPTDRKALSVATHSLSLTPHSTTLWVSGTLSPPRGLGAATWVAARPYREPRRWPVRVQRVAQSLCL